MCLREILRNMGTDCPAYDIKYIEILHSFLTAILYTLQLYTIIQFVRENHFPGKEMRRLCADYGSLPETGVKTGKMHIVSLYPSLLYHGQSRPFLSYWRHVFSSIYPWFRLYPLQLPLQASQELLSVFSEVSFIWSGQNNGISSILFNPVHDTQAQIRRNILFVWPADLYF